MYRRFLQIAVCVILLSTTVNSMNAETLSNQALSLEGHRFELQNGLTVLLKPSHQANTVSAYLGIKTGSAGEAERTGSGLSHFVEHMFFKGTEKRPVGTIETEVRDIGGYINAYTAHDVTVYYINALAPYLDKILDILSDAAFNASLDPEELERERQVILSEMRMNEDRLSRKALLSLWNLRYRKHPYGHPVIGYPSLFKQISRDDLMTFYKTNYIPNNMVLSIAGNIDLKTMEEKVKKYFEPVPRGWVLVQSRPEEPNQLTPRRSTIHKEAEHTRLYLGFPSVPLNHEDTTALDILGSLLGQGDSSRLNQSVKEKKDLVLGIGSYNGSLEESGLFTIQSVLIPEKLTQAREAIHHEIDLLKNKGISDEELKKIKNQVLADYYGRFETHSAIAHELLNNEIYTGDYLFSEKYVKNVETITAKDVQRVAQSYLVWDRVNEIVLSPTRAEKGDLLSDTIPLNRLPVESYKLENGLKVLLIPDSTTPTVSMEWLMQGGVYFEESPAFGAGNLTAQLLIKGTAKRDQEEISKRVESWGGGLDAFSGLHSLGFSISALSQYTLDGLDLMIEIIEQPAFPREEFEKLKEHQIEAIRAKTENVFAYTQDHFAELLYQTHPYARDPLGTKESVAGLDLDHILAFYQSTLDPSRSVLAIAGNISPKDLRMEIKKRFGKIKSRQDKPVREFQQEPLLDVRKKTVTLPREQSVVMIGFNSTHLGDTQKYAYEILNSIMTGSAGRLYQNIREKEGLSYVVGSRLMLGPDPGHFVLYASVEPGQSKRTLDLLLKEIERLQEAGITQEELAGAKQSLIGQFEQTMESKTARMQEMALFELYGIGYETWLQYPEAIRQVNASEVRGVIDKYINTNRIVQLILESKKPVSKNPQAASVASLKKEGSAL